VNGLGGSAQTGPSDGHTVFRVKPGFQFFYTLPVLLALAIFVDALLAPAADKWMFLLLVLILAAISVPRGWSKVTLTGERLTLHAPLRRPRAFDLSRLTAIEVSPRIGQALVLHYHPDDERGRPDPANETVLGLPPLQDQWMLEASLQEALHNFHHVAGGDDRMMEH
jgi:hypothetical protein